jgi:hypothetical protein
MKHQFLLDEHRLAIIVAALILALYGPAIIQLLLRK